MAEEKYCVLKISEKLCILNMGAYNQRPSYHYSCQLHMHPLVSTTLKANWLGKATFDHNPNCTWYIMISTTSLCIVSPHWLAVVISGCLLPASSNNDISAAPEPFYFPFTACLAACSCINTSQKNLFPSIMVEVVVTVLWHINITASRQKNT